VSDLFGNPTHEAELPATPFGEPPGWLVVGAPVYAKVGATRGWSVAIVQKVRTDKGDAKLTYPERDAKVNTGRPQEGWRTWDRLRPRDPALRGSDRPHRGTWPPEGGAA
jgi:hypothetical protein